MSPHFLNKFTAHLKNVLKDAAALAMELRHPLLNPEHLLYALARQKGSIGTEILMKAGMTPESLMESIVRRYPLAPSTETGDTIEEPALSPESKKAIERA